MSNDRLAFFGLRSTVGYFKSRQGLAALDLRLKSAALLYNHLLLEAGVYEATVTDRGSMAAVMPLVSEEQLRPIRTRRGVLAGFRVAPTGSDEFTTMMAGHTEVRFRSQFYSTMRELDAFEVDWVEHISLTVNAERAAKKLAGDWNWTERESVQSLMPNASIWLRNRVHEDLNHDLAQAAVLGAELLPDGSNEDLLRAKVERGDIKVKTTGERTLRLLIPDIRYASWSDVVEVRQMAGMKHLREKLREWDGVSRSDEQVLIEFQEDLLRLYDELRPKTRNLVLTLVTLGVGLLPVGGTVTEGIGAAKSIVDVHMASRHWAATLVGARARLHRAPKAATPVGVGGPP